jgi:prepilin-type N-terminal cleavage/methylation domain-containing protein
VSLALKSTASRPPKPDGPIARAFAAGFTLVEMLVVLVIIGLISTVLLGGFERVLDIRLRLVDFLDGVEAPELVSDWFRGTVGGIVADAPTGADRFTGTATRLTGLSLAALNGTAGVPTPITWEVAFNEETGRTQLRYRNGADPWMVIASWPGDSGGLAYCGADRMCHDAWPPDKDAAQLPQLVRLDAVKGDRRWAILAAPQSDRAPLLTSAGR